MTEKQRENKMKQSNLLSFVSRASKGPNDMPSIKKEPEGKQQAISPIRQVESKQCDDEDVRKPLTKLRRLTLGDRRESDSEEDENRQREKEEEDSFPMKKREKGNRSRSRSKNKNPSTKPNRKSQQPKAAERLSIVKKEEDQQKQLMDFKDKTPIWAMKNTDKCLDKQGRNFRDPNYDPTTLLVPQAERNKLTNTMKQYWDIKSQNFDKIVLFKLGKFYELFYEDAEVTNKFLSLKWMGQNMHTGFPQKSLDRYVKQLVELGYKVVVVEQMETPAEMLERVKEQKVHKKVDKVLQREVTQVLTKGTYTNTSIEDMTTNYASNFLISIYVDQPQYAFALLDTANNKILIGVSTSHDEFKTMLYRTRPVELLFDPANVPYDDKRMMTQSFLGMIKSPLQNKNNLWHHLNSMNLFRDFEEANKRKQFMPGQFTEYSQNHQHMMYSCLSGLMTYLRSLLMLDTVLQTVNIQMYNPKKMTQEYMILDSQALQHLEILQTSLGDATGSLFSKICQCKTAFGKRLLRKWIYSPSTNLVVINNRLDAIEDFIANQNVKSKLQEGLGKLKDLERLLNRLYRYSVKSLANKAVYFSDINTSRMKEYQELMQQFEESWHLLMKTREQIGKCKSRRLGNLLTVQYNDEPFVEEGEKSEGLRPMLPDILKHLAQINSFVKWQDGKPMPQKGLSEEYDEAVEDINRIQDKLHRYLEQQRMFFRQPCIKFTHTKERYEIELPERAVTKKDSRYIFTSKRKDYERYVTKESRDLVKKLEEAEERKNDKLRTFTIFFFEQLKNKNRLWENYIRCLAQIDCLVSLSAVSLTWSGTRPKFNKDGLLHIVKGSHPCIEQETFVTNSVQLTQSQPAMLLTGPNMGGKSTLLRMVCILAVLAQIGVFVPCQEYDSIIFDRIFTRIGASDRLLDKKSTFYIEMEETKSILDHATPNSLVIVDELGRGTSTFDGMAIAQSTFKQLTQKIGCKTLFATHYTILVEQFLFNPHTNISHMSYVVNEETKRIRFLYRLKPGKSSESFGVNVARMVGVNDWIIQKAEQLAAIMKVEIQDKRSKQIESQIKEILQQFRL